MIKLQKEELKTYKYLTIDPGCRADGGTGVALINSVDDIIAYPIIPIATKKEPWEQKIEEVCINYCKLITNFKKNRIIDLTTKVFIEKPKFFNTWKGARAANSESLFKLIVCYARIKQISIMQVPSVNDVEIIHWKGQLSKEQVKARVKKQTGKDFVGDCIDAVGIGLYILRKQGC